MENEIKTMVEYLTDCGKINVNRNIKDCCYYITMEGQTNIITIDDLEIAVSRNDKEMLRDILALNIKAAWGK